MTRKKLVSTSALTSPVSFWDVTAPTVVRALGARDALWVGLVPPVLQGLA